ncbi:MAG TPA: DNA-processing protein DprA [Terriglobales bacterium]|nr:DNA-processing protein DprA [Terriglobales bacterium]
MASAPTTADSAPLWLGLMLTPGLGHRGAQHLVERFASAEAIYAASLTELEACQVPAAVAQFIHSGRAAAAGAEEAARAQAQGVQVITLGDRAYPELLREIYDPPLALYVRGSPEAVGSFGVALVGTRHPSVYGRIMAERLARELTQWGVTIFSGLARGVDGIGQKSCIEAGGRTVAVLGTGVDLIYPSENRKLAESILSSGGALVSEFALGTAPVAQNFPIRNRVISGISLGVLVIEGGEYSGSRITARMALEQDREVFAVPGMATQKQAWLPNALIKQGAKLTTEAADVIQELPSSVRVRLIAPSPAPAADRAPEESGKGPKSRVLALLPVDDALHVDEIVNLLENALSAPEVLALLFDLELEGRIRQIPGKKYLRVS